MPPYAPPDKDHVDALHGHRLPPDPNHWVEACIIHGIRHNEAFANSEAVRKLCSESDRRCYARARNARLIMSNIVPEIVRDDDKPYCIWYPDLAREETYRDLLMRYPEMRYTVGRACAVAGYAKLYHELDILPEVSIAEEARDNSESEGSKAILDTIMRQPVCFAVLNDYNRTFNFDNPSSPTWMNGDTAVRSSLNVRLGPEKYEEWGLHYFNIAEDYNIDKVSSKVTNYKPLSPEDLALFYTPLLPHLQTTNKDALILMAAYEGNLDRYVRLRRPVMLHDEARAAVRGIYHNTTFAKWWSLQEIQSELCHIKTACIARFIMVNDLSHITPNSPSRDDMPSLIWWPLIPRESTLKELVRRRPDMKLQAAMACIEGDYRVLWDELSPEPCGELWEQARQEQAHSWLSGANQNYYVDYLERRAKEMGVSVHRTNNATSCLDAAVRDKEPTTLWLDTCVVGRPYTLVDSNPGESIYPGGTQAKAAKWELLICSSEELRREAGDEGEMLLYNDYVFPDEE